jgi:outer membrane protein TolC
MRLRQLENLLMFIRNVLMWGLANTFELQQARTNLLRAESQLIQAKYTYVLDLKILDFYQGKPISLQ